MLGEFEEYLLENPEEREWLDNFHERCDEEASSGRPRSPLDQTTKLTVRLICARLSPDLQGRVLEHLKHLKRQNQGDKVTPWAKRDRFCEGLFQFGVLTRDQWDRAKELAREHILKQSPTTPHEEALSLAVAGEDGGSVDAFTAALDPTQRGASPKKKGRKDSYANYASLGSGLRSAPAEKPAWRPLALPALPALPEPIPTRRLSQMGIQTTDEITELRAEVARLLPFEARCASLEARCAELETKIARFCQSFGYTQ